MASHNLPSAVSSDPPAKESDDDDDEEGYFGVPGTSLETQTRCPLRRHPHAGQTTH